MAGGTHGPARPGNTETDYNQPWVGIDASKPNSQLAPGAASTAQGMDIRGGLAPQPALVQPIGSNLPILTPPIFSPPYVVTPTPFGQEWTIGNDEAILLITNLGGVTYVFTNYKVYSDYSTSASTTKAFVPIFIWSSFPVVYSKAAKFASVVIGQTLYVSSNEVRGVYAITNGGTVTEITAQNGSEPFIGGAFMCTIAQRLVLGNIIGGDGNQTGSVATVVIDNGGSGYPASGTGTFTGGGGVLASFTWTSTAGVIDTITSITPGSEFLSAPTPIIVGTTGTGFVGHTTITGFTTNSTDTLFPDYVAWSFPSAYGSFDPNSTLLGGGFDQLTEARGLITGLAVFEAVAFVAHNGGFTEMVPNTSGSNIEPFTFAPLWASDQGVVCRFGSMAQYGAEVRFLGEDQPYQLSPGGLTPFGDSVASLLQNYAIWNNGNFPNAGLFGSIVEFEGEKHYLIGFSSDQPLPLNTANSARQVIVYDANLKTGSWNVWTYANITMTCPIYQSYDTQVMKGVGSNIIIDRDNLVLMGIQNSTPNGALDIGIPYLAEVMAGAQLYPLTQQNGVPRYGSEFFTYVFRVETPTMGRPQANRSLLIEYENLPQSTGPSGVSQTVLTCTIYGQPDKDGTFSFPAPLSNPFQITLPYFPFSSIVPRGTILTATGEMSGTAATFLATSVQIITPNMVRIVRVSIVAENTQGAMQ